MMSSCFFLKGTETILKALGVQRSTKRRKEKKDPKTPYTLKQQDHNDEFMPQGTFQIKGTCKKSAAWILLPSWFGSTLSQLLVVLRWLNLLKVIFWSDFHMFLPKCSTWSKFQQCGGPLCGVTHCLRGTSFFGICLHLTVVRKKNDKRSD